MWELVDFVSFPAMSGTVAVFVECKKNNKNFKVTASSICKEKDLKIVPYLHADSCNESILSIISDGFLQQALLSLTLCKEERS